MDTDGCTNCKHTLRYALQGCKPIIWGNSSLKLPNFCLHRHGLMRNFLQSYFITKQRLLSALWSRWNKQYVCLLDHCSEPTLSIHIHCVHCRSPVLVVRQRVILFPVSTSLRYVWLTYIDHFIDSQIQNESVLPLQLERIRFVLCSYLRTRLQKVVCMCIRAVARWGHM